MLRIEQQRATSFLAWHSVVSPSIPRTNLAPRVLCALRAFVVRRCRSDLATKKDQPFHTARFACILPLSRSPARIFVITLENVHKAFGPKKVLQGFSLEVPEGDTVAIIGYSGTGKSVAIKHIVGLLEPDQGTVFVDGQEVPTLDRQALYRLRAQIGYVFQFAALFDSLSVGDNVAMGLRKQGGLARREIDERVHEALALVDLPGAAGIMPIELSGGMRKRVGIARAIALRPKYLLYDEPTTGLDPVTSAVINELMLRMQRTLGVTSIVITHDMHSAYTVATRIAMLYEGTVRQVGTVDEIRHSDDPVVRGFIEGRADVDPGHSI